MPTASSRPVLLGRRAECETLSGLIAAATAGRSQILVLRGEAGIGKTALLEFLLERATGCQVLRAVGVESETEWAFAGLHQLCGPHLDGLGTLPAPQQDALSTAFGLRAGPAPDRFLVGLAVLTLLTHVAEEQPLVCIVDDAQWLDRESAHTLEFVARRLAAEPVAMVFAARSPNGDLRLSGLPELTVPRLRNGDAAALLERSVTGALDPRVRERILAESRGNPLALLELPRALSASELALGGNTAAGTTPLRHRLAEEFARQVRPLSWQTRQLLLLAAAEPFGDVPLLWCAAERLGIGTDAVVPAEEAGLIELHDRVRFRHPLVRSAVYHSATHGERRRVHQALAEATAPDRDPDRRAWHRACAAVGPDEEVAGELERCAGRALAQGGLAAAAAFLDRAATLTPDPVRRARRSLDAARARMDAGALDDASALLTAAAAGPLGEAEQARLELLQAQMCSAVEPGNGAVPLLLAAARRLEAIDAGLARGGYLDALSAAVIAGRLATGPDARQVAEAVRKAPAPPCPGKRDALLEGLCLLFTDGYAPSVAACRRAVEGFAGEDVTTDEAFRSGWLAATTAASLWDDAGWDDVSRRYLELTREAGAVSALPSALTTRTLVHLFTGDLAAAAVLVEQTRTAAEATGSTPVPFGSAGLLALRGRPEQAEPVLQSCLDDVRARGEGVGVSTIQWARAVLCNGLGRYRDALVAAREATADSPELGPVTWALSELVEAAVRCGEVGAAEAALQQLSAMARASGSDWALGVAASRRALLCAGTDADDLHREALERLGRTRVRLELARAQLLYGEWLRREGRRTEARAQLRSAYDVLSAMGVGAFAERARRELLATGETVRRRTPQAATELTAQERHIARLAARGMTNSEIGAELFLSARTVEWHLRKIFLKSGVTTRRELRRTFGVRERTVSTTGLPDQ